MDFIFYKINKNHVCMSDMEEVKLSRGTEGLMRGERHPGDVGDIIKVHCRLT